MLMLDYLLVQAGEVEFVLDIILVDLAEELVAAEAAEPRDPAHFLGTAHAAAATSNRAEGQIEGDESPGSKRLRENNESRVRTPNPLLRSTEYG